jgi:hypothetical protein
VHRGVSAVILGTTEAMKVGRNGPCPCGSGIKYKRCCLNNAKLDATPSAMPRSPEVLLRQARHELRLHEAAENVRRQQQGHGTPIVSSTSAGFRFVAVGNTIHWDKNWVLFPNFLAHFMKKTLGHEWGERERGKGEHPVFRWLAKTQQYGPKIPGEPR